MKLNAVGMTDMVAAEFIPWETIDLITIQSLQTTKPIPKINARGMTDMVAAEFIPWVMMIRAETNFCGNN